MTDKYGVWRVRPCFPSDAELPAWRETEALLQAAMQSYYSNMGSIEDGMPRTEGTEPELMHPDAAGHFQRTVTYPPRPVWVRLDALVIRDPGTPKHTNGAGVIMRGERPGVLTHWVPTVDGDWMGRVIFSVQYADGRPDLQVNDQLVPAYALRPRREDQ